MSEGCIFIPPNSLNSKYSLIAYQWKVHSIRPWTFCFQSLNDCTPLQEFIALFNVQAQVEKFILMRFYTFFLTQSIKASFVSLILRDFCNFVP